jgi:DNA mismatch repair protein PMS2
VINDVYRQANPGQSAIFFLNLTLDTNSYDVNVTPDKRTIMLHDESDVIQALKVSAGPSLVHVSFVRGHTRYTQPEGGS